jgi:hypothetical protein
MATLAAWYSIAITGWPMRFRTTLKEASDDR